MRDNWASDRPSSPRKYGWNYCIDCLANQRPSCPSWKIGGKYSISSLYTSDFHLSLKSCQVEHFRLRVNCWKSHIAENRTLFKTLGCWRLCFIFFFFESIYRKTWTIATIWYKKKNYLDYHYFVPTLERLTIAIFWFLSMLMKIISYRS